MARVVFLGGHPAKYLPLACAWECVFCVHCLVFIMATILGNKAITHYRR